VVPKRFEYKNLLLTSKILWTLSPTHTLTLALLGSVYSEGEQDQKKFTGCFTTLGHNCRRWFPRSLWWKKFI